MLTRHLTKTTFVSLLVFSCAALQVIADDEPKAADNATEPAPGTHQFVERALGKAVSISAVDKPLIDVMDDLEAQVDVDIHLDTFALDAVGIGSDTPVTVSLEKLPLRSTLGFILDQMELDYMNYEGVVMITTPEAEEQNLQTKTYEVVDLVGKDDDTPPSQYDYDSLIDAIVITLAPQTWDNVGGPGSITGYQGTIVVAATQEVQQQVARLLAAMRKAKQLVAKHHRNAPPQASIPISANAAKENARIEKVLDSIVALEFLEIPLSDVVAQISKKYKINVLLDVRALDAVGLGNETPITTSFKNVKLRQALRLLLRHLELTFSVRDGVLLITTREEDWQNLITRLYPVLDLVGVVPGTSDFTGEKPESDYDYESLTEVTVTTIDPTMWEEVGGPASIVAMHSYGFLVVSQVYEGHLELEKFFKSLRQTVPAEARITGRVGNAPVRLVVYQVPKPDSEDEGGKKMNEKTSAGDVPQRRRWPSGFGGAAPGGIGGGTLGISYGLPNEQELLELITSLIEPESWTERDDVYARAVTGRLVIRHTDSVHQQIRELAKRLGIFGFVETSPWWWGTSGRGPRDLAGISGPS